MPKTRREIVDWARGLADIPAAVIKYSGELGAAQAAYDLAQIPYRVGGIDPRSGYRKKYYDTKTPEGRRIQYLGKLVAELQYESRRRAHLNTCPICSERQHDAE